MSGLSANAKVNLVANCLGALHSYLYCFPWPRPKFGGYFSFAENFSRCQSQKVRLIIIIFLMFFFFVKDVNE